MSGFSSSLRQLRERKLVQWAFAYLAAAWLLLQIVDVIAEPWNLSSTFIRSLQIVLGLGLLVTLVVAWYHGEQGRQRATGPELLIIGAISGLAAVVLAVFGSSGSRADAAEDATMRIERTRPAVAVLPFDNISPDPDDAFFADGIHEEIITQLSKLSEIDVISRTSTMQFREHSLSMPAIAAQLNATVIAEGSVRLAGDRVRITIQLIDGTTDTHAWSETFEREYTTENLFEIQAEIARRVASALERQVAGDEAELIDARPTDDAAAYSHYLRGHTHRARRGVRDRLLLSIEAYEAAVEADPEFGLAWAALAGVRIYGFRLTGIPSLGIPAQRALEKARELAPEASETLLAEAEYQYMIEGDFDTARSILEAARRKAPGSVDLLLALADLERRRGAGSESLRFIEEARGLEPVSSRIDGQLASRLSSLGRYDEATQALERAATLTPQSLNYHARLLLMTLVAGDTIAARTRVEQFAADIVAGLPGALFWGWPATNLAYYRGDLATALARQLPFEINRRHVGIIAFLTGDQALTVRTAADIRADWQARLDEIENTEGPYQRSLGAVAHAQLAIAAGLEGDETEVQTRASAVSELTPVSFDASHAPRWHYMIAEAFMLIGDHDQALEFLQIYADAPYHMFPPSVLALDPLFEPIRANQRFQAIVAR